MAGGLGYGYRVRSLGEWEMIPEEAAVMVHIMRPDPNEAARESRRRVAQDPRGSFARN
jgi:hypothetical protein